MIAFALEPLRSFKAAMAANTFALVRGGLLTAFFFLAKADFLTTRRVLALAIFECEFFHGAQKVRLNGSRTCSK